MVETVKDPNEDIFKLNVNGYIKDGFTLESSGLIFENYGADDCGRLWWAIVKKEDNNYAENTDNV